MKKSDLRIAIASVLVVLVALAVCFIESYFLVKNGLSFDAAFLTSLYTGFLAVVVLFAVVISSGDWFYNFIEK